MKRFRDLAGLSQSDLAETLGVSVDSIQNWEQQRTIPMGLARVALLRFLVSQLPHTSEPIE